ncbi:MAG: cupin domain-containing protein [Gammaproteobacteria bacterium]|nr:cupin domain-containing protein [Gammaproteobacteria bacterium]
MNSQLIGGVGLSHLWVYHQRPGPDGVNGGCAHVHALSDEAYYCVSGKGAVELHDLDRGFVRHPMQPGDYLQFPPATLHRSISYQECEFLVVMGNGGLPEQGDARIYFGPEVDAAPEVYLQLKDLSSSGLEGALARRDASALAYQRLLELWTRDRPAYRAELSRFIGLHRRELADRRTDFEGLILGGVGAVLKNALARVRALPTAVGSTSEPAAALASPARVYGMCGVLRQVTLAANSVPLVGSQDASGRRGR